MARVPPTTADLEELPEADRLEGFPHPRATAALYGHEEAERALVRAFSSGRVHHGWLICGAEGIGKATLAYRFARYALAEPGERQSVSESLEVSAHSTAARQVRALSHPGLLVIRRAYDTKTKRFPATIPVEEVRRLKSFLGRTAEAGAWRVVIVDKADELNNSAANALLKSLEEPPARTIFLVVSSAPGQLLATIRSRLRRLDLAPLRADALRDAATQAIAGSEADSGVAAPLPSQWEELESLAGGSVRRLLFLHAARGLALYKRITAIVSGLPKVDWGVVHALGDELAGGAAEAEFELFFDLLMYYLARLIKVRATGEGTAGDQAVAARLIGEGQLASWAALWERVAAGKADAAALNLDRKGLILETMLALEAAAAQT
jgi:DNA polymerase-3 subunit delta'